MITWKRLGLKNYKFPDIKEYSKEYLKYPKPLPQGIRLEEYSNNLDIIEPQGLDTPIEQGLGREIIRHASKSYNSGIYLLASEGVKLDEPIRMEFNMDKQNPSLVDYNIIVAGPNSEISLIFDYSTEEEVNAFHNGLTKVYGGQGSIVNIIKIQRMNKDSYNFDSNIAFIEGNGRVNWISVELATKISASNYTTILDGLASQSDLKSVYLGDGSSKMDLGYTMVHKGPRSISNIETKGILKDKSKKIFRGNLDFKRGAKHSKGVEEEYVILFDPTVKSDSIPALLCEEDDVEGEHAVSAGQIDESKLFYLMSRGLNEREAKKLIVEASFKPIINKIPCYELRKQIDKEIEGRLINGQF